MKKILFVLLVFVATNVFGVTQRGKIVGYVPYHNGTVKNFALKIENNIVEGCNVSGRFYFDETTLAYSEMVSSIIAAYHSQTPVTVYYNKTCNTWGNAYDVKYVCVGDINC